jgi:hypothetical protein
VGKAGGDAPSCRNGATIREPHAGHFERLPAYSSLTANRLPHDPHENLIAIDLPPQQDAADAFAIHDISAGRSRPIGSAVH